MSNPLMPVVAQLPATRWTTQEPVLILGFDATDALCVTRDGKLNYVGHDELVIDWQFDNDAGVWTSSANTAEDLILADADSLERGSEAPSEDHSSTEADPQVPPTV